MRKIGRSIPIEDRLKHICKRGYVSYKGKWYHGNCTDYVQKDCNLCDFCGEDFSRR